MGFLLVVTIKLWSMERDQMRGSCNVMNALMKTIHTLGKIMLFSLESCHESLMPKNLLSLLETNKFLGFLSIGCVYILIKALLKC
jgi:ABC-type xylose transport system permease subunit